MVEAKPYYPPSAVLSVPTFAFDGHTFVRPGGTDAPGMMVGLYLAKRARGGDADAAAVLEAVKVTIRTSGGGAYWPSVIHAQGTGERRAEFGG